MTEDTLTKEINNLRKDIAKILANQANLSQQFHVLARQVERIEGPIPGAFESSAKAWQIDHRPSK